MSSLSSEKVTMPKWPAWVLFAAMAASAYPAITATPPRNGEAAAAASFIEATAPAEVQNLKSASAAPLAK